MRVLALSPPIALQQRANSSDADSACKVRANGLRSGVRHMSFAEVFYI
jgi:hypothetical protein